MIRKISLFVISLVSLLTLLILFYVYYNFPPLGKDYNRSVYSVVLYNQTDKTLDNIYIMCGCDVEIPETVEKVGEVNNLKPNEYRKVNISTENPPQKAEVPYNVNVVLNDFNTYEAAGYFGIETGGLAVLSIIENNGNVSLKRVYEDEILYKIINIRHNNNQNELSW